MMNPISAPISSDSTVESSQELPEGTGDCVSEEREFVLPEPDPEQIAVLTNKLPDTPILPWNHYDSPWREEEEEVPEVAQESEANILAAESELFEGDEVV